MFYRENIEEVCCGGGGRWGKIFLEIWPHNWATWCLKRVFKQQNTLILTWNLTICEKRRIISIFFRKKLGGKILKWKNWGKWWSGLSLCVSFFSPFIKKSFPPYAKYTPLHFFHIFVLIEGSYSPQVFFKVSCFLLSVFLSSRSFFLFTVFFRFIFFIIFF